MTGTIQIPSKGDGLKAAWGASVANGLNALMPMAPARMLVREGAGGVGCEPLPQNLRDRKAAYRDRSRYCIKAIYDDEESEDDEEPKKIVEFGNPYYRIGGRTFVGPDSTVCESLPAIIALKVDITEELPRAEFSHYSSLEDIQEDELDEDYYIHPLYELDDSCAVICDFRIGPTSEMGEFKKKVEEEIE